MNGFIRIVEAHLEVFSDMVFGDEGAVVAGLIGEELRESEDVLFV